MRKHQYKNIVIINKTSSNASIRTRHATAEQASVRKKKSPRSHTRVGNIALSKSEQRRKARGDVLSMERKDIMQDSASQTKNS